LYAVVLNTARNESVSTKGRDFRVSGLDLGSSVWGSGSVLDFRVQGSVCPIRHQEKHSHVIARPISSSCRAALADCVCFRIAPRWITCPKILVRMDPLGSSSSQHRRTLELVLQKSLEGGPHHAMTGRILLYRSSCLS
jgi:hypothetical protein